MNHVLPLMFKVATLAVTVLTLGACSTPAPPMAHSPEFAPVMPSAVERPRMATGAIYNGRMSDNFFGRTRNYRVGDVITVDLNESTQAGRQQINNLSREAANDVVPSGLTSRLAGAALPTKILGTKLDGVLGGLNLNAATIESAGKGTADQRASLSGSVTVTVTEVLPNGNLMVRGEKQLALTEGAEVIQVSGIIRPDDVSPNNVVQSRRLANAQIAYRGSGDMANATKAGWGTRALFSLWPF
ncbi:MULTISPECIES: flagellar basal body L-ring protein FlgH [unclassified Limnohabitans]|uniref:flagellar basal body L-ring protein FlgH n=1 Tax=unclassified Limnohabitans TaxID=2626134 RepID=UPI000A601184|nr:MULTISPECIES: flagellar basal body L-ring protein FlgH [unclassified Limnohabitans]